MHAPSMRPIPGDPKCPMQMYSSRVRLPLTRACGCPPQCGGTPPARRAWGQHREWGRHSTCEHAQGRRRNMGAYTILHRMDEPLYGPRPASRSSSSLSGEGGHITITGQFRPAGGRHRTVMGQVQRRVGQVQRRARQGMGIGRAPRGQSRPTRNAGRRRRRRMYKDVGRCGRVQLFHLIENGQMKAMVTTIT